MKRTKKENIIHELKVTRHMLYLMDQDSKFRIYENEIAALDEAIKIIEAEENI